MLLQISLVIFVNQARNQSSSFLEVSFTRFSVTQRVENNYLQLKNRQDKPRSRWSSRDLSLATLRQVENRLIKILTFNILLSKRNWTLFSKGEGYIPLVIPHEGRESQGWFWVTAKFVELKPLQMVRFRYLAGYKSWEEGLVADASSFMTCLPWYWLSLSRFCYWKLPWILALAFLFNT